MSDSEEWVNHQGVSFTMKTDAFRGEFGRECGGMWALLGSLVNRFIWYEPCVSSTALVFAIGVRPSLNIALVRIRNTDGKPIQPGLALWREVKHIFVTVVQITPGIDRLEVAEGVGLPVPFNRNGLNPMDCILQLKQSFH